MSSFSVGDSESQPRPLTPSYSSRPTTVFSDLGLAGYSTSLTLFETQRAASSTTRLPTKHRRCQTEGQDARRNIGKFSKLLGTVLGTPFSSPPIISGTHMANSHPRSASPSPSTDYTLVSVPSIPSTPQHQSITLNADSMRTVTPENLTTCSSRSMFFTSPSKKGLDSIQGHTTPPSPTKSGSQRILPRLWTAFSSPSREAGIRFKRKGKRKAVGSGSFNDYPLDGEEGELVDDEACFVKIPTAIGLSPFLLSFPSLIIAFLRCHLWSST